MMGELPARVSKWKRDILKKKAKRARRAKGTRGDDKASKEITKKVGLRVKELNTFGLAAQARNGCKKCYGRGVIGYLTGTSTRVVCSCVLNRLTKMALRERVATHTPILGS